MFHINICDSHYNQNTFASVIQIQSEYSYHEEFLSYDEVFYHVFITKGNIFINMHWVEIFVHFVILNVTNNSEMPRKCYILITSVIRLRKNEKNIL